MESICDCWYNWSWQLYEAKICDIKIFFLYLEKDCTSNDGKNKITFSCLFIQIDFISLAWEQCSWKRFLNKQTVVGYSWLQSYIWDLVLEFVFLDFSSLFFDLLLTILTILLYFLVWVSANLCLELWKWFDRKT